MSRTLNVRISTAPDALDRFEAAWHMATGRAAPEPVRVLSFADLPTLLKTLTPARWELIERLRVRGPFSVNALAKLLGRDYKNVYMDVKQLAAVGLVTRRADTRVEVAWDAVRAELQF